MTSHQAEAFFLPSLNSDPQLTSSGGIPMPKNDKVDSSSTFPAKFIAANTSRVGIMLGRMCFIKMEKCPAPIIREAVTKSRSFTLRVSALACLANPVHPKIKMTKITLLMWGRVNKGNKTNNKIRVGIERLSAIILVKIPSNGR